MQSPNVLVCVGQEPFRPFLLDTIKKYTEESLPRLDAKSHSDLYSEGGENKNGAQIYRLITAKIRTRWQLGFIFPF